MSVGDSEREREFSDDDRSERLGTRRTRTIVDGAGRDGRSDGTEGRLFVGAFDVVEQQACTVSVMISIHEMMMMVVTPVRCRSHLAAFPFQI